MELQAMLNKSQIGYLLMQLDCCFNILATTNTIPQISKAGAFWVDHESQRISTPYADSKSPEDWNSFIWYL